MAPRGSFGINEKRSVFLEFVLVGRDITRACLICDDRAADQAFLHQSPNALVHIFLFHRNPGLGYAGECAPVRVYACRVNEDCNYKSYNICAGDEKDVRESTRLVALVDGVRWGEDDEAEKDDGEEEKAGCVEKTLKSDCHGFPCASCMTVGWGLADLSHEA